MYYRHHIRVPASVIGFMLLAVHSLLAQPQTINADLTVSGNAVMLESARIDGPLRIGASPSGSGLRPDRSIDPPSLTFSITRQV
jgi:hypothetical protein